MGRSRLLLRLGVFAALGIAAQAAYTIQDSYDSKNFFDGFEFFSEADPTKGFVKYHDAASANAKSLAGYAQNGIYLGSDSKTANPSPGRSSTRLSSKKTYTKGLIIADIAHMPTSSKSGCGVWPAFWTFGPKWPASGEIDIIEGVNSATSTTLTLHTSAGCTFSQGDCGKDQGHAGCSNPIQNPQTYGAGFNKVGGGVYATEWTSDAIKIWFFPRSAIPADITGGKPNPAAWGKAMGAFAGGCNIDQHFKDHQIVFNTDFCGAWAGAPEVWGKDPTCSALAPTCDQYVAANPGDFKEAYWIINSVKVYSANGGKRDTIAQPFTS